MMPHKRSIPDTGWYSKMFDTDRLAAALYHDLGFCHNCGLDHDQQMAEHMTWVAVERARHAVRDNEALAEVLWNADFLNAYADPVDARRFAAAITAALEDQSGKQPCEACGHHAPHDSPGKSMNGCVVDVMHDEGDGPPYFLQCCCDGKTGHVIKTRGVQRW